jgi:hypothetical protein
MFCNMQGFAIPIRKRSSQDRTHGFETGLWPTAMSHANLAVDLPMQRRLLRRVEAEMSCERKITIHCFEFKPKVHAYQVDAE